jgi:acyl-coenzyme A thioesterase PaaI-like protein
MQPRTHLALNPKLCGTLRELAAGSARMELVTNAEMAADSRGLVHGGFVFGLADAAAMFAIDEPNVVLGSAETRFLAPVVAGETLLATATVTRIEGKKHYVEVDVRRRFEGGGPAHEQNEKSEAGQPAREELKVFQGTFVCFVPARHVLDGRETP